jgi:ATP-dependent Clp protease adaptor protein ClpS
MTKRESGSGTETLSKERVKVKRPPMYRVILLNDDFTTMDFVVSVLENIFKKPPAEAVRIMMQVHKEGQGVCGLYPRQIAEAKIIQVHERAKSEGYPLRCTMEEA